jgi:hypothetical protein
VIAQPLGLLEAQPFFRGRSTITLAMSGRIRISRRYGLTFVVVFLPCHLDKKGRPKARVRLL